VIVMALRDLVFEAESVLVDRNDLRIIPRMHILKRKWDIGLLDEEDGGKNRRDFSRIVHEFSCLFYEIRSTTQSYQTVGLFGWIRDFVRKSIFGVPRVAVAPTATVALGKMNSFSDVPFVNRGQAIRQLVWF